MKPPYALRVSLSFSLFAQLTPLLHAQNVYTATLEAEISKLDAALNSQHKEEITTPEFGTDTPTARGVIRAAQTAEIGASMSAKLLKLPYESGQSFKKGDLLAQFDCRQEQAEADALEHAASALRAKHKNIKELLALGAAGNLEEEIAHADSARAAADRNVAKTRLKKCFIYAPFNGKIKTKYASAFSRPTLGQPLYAIIKTGKLEIKLITPSLWMRWMKQGTHFKFNIDETGDVYNAKIIRLGASVDPVSQTIEATARFTSSAPNALPGMSGLAQFNRPENGSY